MPHCVIDHITVTSPTLAAGARFVEDVLGMQPQPGGKHPRMGTHNLLLRLGDTMFLEVIAPDPDADPPARPRWFGLDGLRPGSAPALTTWVARTGDIHGRAQAACESLGVVEPMRRGALDWQITIPGDGSVALDGVGPALIQWQPGPHPAAGLASSGLTLAGLELFHFAPARVTALLASIGFQGPVTVSALARGEAPYLLATINTPHGLRKLSIPGAAD